MRSELSPVIQELAPEGLSPRPDSQQEKKSAKTRETILEAALDCLAEHGYANTTLSLVCQQAKVSRGSLMYHYPTMLDLMVGVVDYAFYKHITAFRELIAKLTDEERHDQNRGIAIEAQLYRSRETLVYLELRIASRTNNELRTILVPRARHHDRVRKEELLKVFPEWRRDATSDKFSLVRRFSRSILEGMTMGRDVWKDDKADWALLTFTADIVRKLRIGELEFPTAERIEKFRKSASSAAKRPRTSRSKAGARAGKSTDA